MAVKTRKYKGKKKTRKNNKLNKKSRKLYTQKGGIFKYFREKFGKKGTYNVTPNKPTKLELTEEQKLLMRIEKMHVNHKIPEKYIPETIKNIYNRYNKKNLKIKKNNIGYLESYENLLKKDYESEYNRLQTLPIKSTPTPPEITSLLKEIENLHNELSPEKIPANIQEILNRYKNENPETRTNNSQNLEKYKLKLVKPKTQEVVDSINFVKRHPNFNLLTEEQKQYIKNVETASNKHEYHPYIQQIEDLVKPIKKAPLPPGSGPLNESSTNNVISLNKNLEKESSADGPPNVEIERLNVGSSLANQIVTAKGNLKPTPKNSSPNPTNPRNALLEQIRQIGERNKKITNLNQQPAQQTNEPTNEQTPPIKTPQELTGLARSLSVMIPETKQRNTNGNEWNNESNV